MNDDRNVHVETTPHQDGRQEGVIKDAEGVQVGVRVDKKTRETFTTLSEIQDPQMKKFERIMRGEVVDVDNIPSEGKASE